MTSIDRPSHAAQRRGAELLVEILRSEGVRYVFGNPGTTELPVIEALAQADDLSYVLGLQEFGLVAMADGYAQASGRVGFVNLHTAGGLGHAMGAIINAQVSRTPLIVTAGQQDTRHLASDPLLSGNLVGIADPVVKWAREITHPDQIPVLLRRAFNDSKAAPSGPVFLSLPLDVMERTTNADVGKVSRINYRTIAGSLEELSEALARFTPGKLALVAGEEVFVSGAGETVVELAEALGAPVFGSSWPGHISFPTAHVLWRGPLPPQAADMRARLESYEGLFLLGEQSLITYVYTEGPAVPEGCQILQLSANPGDLGRTYPASLACVGDVAASLQALLPLLKKRLEPHRATVATLRDYAWREREAADAALRYQLERELGGATISPFVAAAQVARAIGPDIAIVDEAPATMGDFRTFLHSRQCRQYLFSCSAILGWGMPGAIGTSLGLDRQPVVAVLGDGSSMYTPQSLWTAAHEGVAVTFVVMNNREYNILKVAMRRRMRDTGTRQNRFLGMDLGDPPIDFVGLAQSMGISSRRIDRASDIPGAVEAGIASGRPNLIEVPIATT